MQQVAIRVTNEHMAYIAARVAEAVKTLHRLPTKNANSSKITSWPDFVRSYWEAYGYSDPTPPRIAPSPAHITRMDEVLTWCAWLASVDADYPRILWAHGKGYGFRRIGKVMGMPKSTVHTHHMNALYLLADRYINNT